MKIRVPRTLPFPEGGSVEQQADWVLRSELLKAFKEWFRSYNRLARHWRDYEECRDDCEAGCLTDEHFRRRFLADFQALEGKREVMVRLVNGEPVTPEEWEEVNEDDA